MAIGNMHVVAGVRIDAVRIRRDGIVNDHSLPGLVDILAIQRRKGPERRVNHCDAFDQNIRAVVRLKEWRAQKTHLQSLVIFRNERMWIQSRKFLLPFVALAAVFG